VQTVRNNYSVQSGELVAVHIDKEKVSVQHLQGQNCICEGYTLLGSGSPYLFALFEDGSAEVFHLSLRQETQASVSASLKLELQEMASQKQPDSSASALE